jgi:hypothetical protein
VTDPLSAAGLLATLAAHPTATHIPYRPFVDPLELHGSWWLLLLPLSLGISVIYKAVRMRDLDGYWRAVLVMTAQIVLGMLALAVASFLLVELYARWIVSR